MYDIIIKYIASTKNIRVDTLSKKPRYKEDKVYKRIAIFREERGKLISNYKEVTII